jgi:hypothetical protein
MNSGGVNEIIAHFIGYLHIADEEVRARISYDEFLAGRTRSDDFVGAQVANNTTLPDLDDAYSTAVQVNHYPDLLQFQFPFLHYRLYPLDKVPPSNSVNSDLPPKLLIPVSAGSSDPAFAKFEAQQDAEQPPTYSEKIIEIDQRNVLHDNDQFGDTQGLFAELEDIEIEEALLALEQAASETHPDNLPPPGSGVPDLVLWASTKDGGEPSAANDGPGVETLTVGIHINGETVPGPPHLANEGLERFSVRPELEVPTYEYGQVGQVAQLGGNVASNAALIIDADEAVQTMIVLGDVHETNAIVQTNVYRDNDHVQYTGISADDATLETDGNVADNVAEFVDDNPGIDFDFPLFFGDNVHIDVDDGDFYDIKLLTQYNLIVDNDIVVQTNQQTFAEVDAGSSELGNETSLYDAPLNYDLIIVGGDYHRINLIEQTNIIFDDDFVSMGVEAGDDDADNSPAAYSGLNWLFNYAAIHDLGLQSYESLDDHAEVRTFAESAGDGETENSNLEVPVGLAGHGTNTFNVLYAMGNYYDFNVIWQHNTIVDIDGLAQHFGGFGRWGNSIEQYASTGHNAAQNAAEIVDIGALHEQYVGGDHYEDSILIQTNIVAGDDDNVVYGDTSNLIPEVIAFTDPQSDFGHGDEHGGGCAGAAHYDPLGHLLT